MDAWNEYVPGRQFVVVKGLIYGHIDPRDDERVVFSPAPARHEHDLDLTAIPLHRRQGVIERYLGV